MSKTLSQQVLKLAVKKGEFTTPIAYKAFTAYFDNAQIHNSVMRRARELSDAGLLKRTGRGTFVPTARGRKAAAK